MLFPAKVVSNPSMRASALTTQLTLVMSSSRGPVPGAAQLQTQEGAGGPCELIN